MGRPFPRKLIIFTGGPGPLSNMWILQPFLHSSWRSVVKHARACPFLEKLPLGMEDLNPHNTCFLGPILVHNPKASRSVQQLLHSSWHGTELSLMSGHALRLNIVPSHRGTWTICGGTPLLSIPYAISIGSVVFTAHDRQYLYFVMCPFPTKNCPFPSGIWTPIKYMVPWAHPCPEAK